jgi:hypothetical protein
MKTIISWTAVFMTLAALAFAGVPQTINYQGYLKNSSTGAPASGSVSMIFSLYSSKPARSNPVWRETQPAVAVNNGIYSTQLGSVTPIAAPFDVPYYLGVKVAGDDEMSLQPLSSVPYALRSGVADAYGAGSVTSAMISDGAVGLDKLADTCAVGQVLKQGVSGWECASRP